MVESGEGFVTTFDQILDYGEKVVNADGSAATRGMFHLHDLDIEITPDIFEAVMRGDCGPILPTNESGLVQRMNMILPSVLFACIRARLIQMSTDLEVRRSNNPLVAPRTGNQPIYIDLGGEYMPLIITDHYSVDQFDQIFSLHINRFDTIPHDVADKKLQTAASLLVGLPRRNAIFRGSRVMRGGEHSLAFAIVASQGDPKAMGVGDIYTKHKTIKTAEEKAQKRERRRSNPDPSRKGVQSRKRAQRAADEVVEQESRLGERNVLREEEE